MIEVRRTAEFDQWLRNLRDRQAKARIAVRLRRVEEGNLGDAKFFGGIGELRIKYGPGYRVYFVQRGSTIIVLLCGGDKDTQSRDIEMAKTLAREVE
ncbi:MAG: type II toxin-antitoxin system RelE/ParE family toxin [Sphingomonadaceae bacterium]